MFLPAILLWEKNVRGKGTGQKGTILKLMERNPTHKVRMWQQETPLETVSTAQVSVGPESHDMQQPPPPSPLDVVVEEVAVEGGLHNARDPHDPVTVAGVGGGGGHTTKWTGKGKMSMFFAVPMVGHGSPAVIITRPHIHTQESIQTPLTYPGCTHAL